MVLDKTYQVMHAVLQNLYNIANYFVDCPSRLDVERRRLLEIASKHNAVRCIRPRFTARNCFSFGVGAILNLFLPLLYKFYSQFFQVNIAVLPLEIMLRRVWSLSIVFSSPDVSCIAGHTEPAKLVSWRDRLFAHHSEHFMTPYWEKTIKSSYFICWRLVY